MAAAEAPLRASLPASFREMREAGQLVDVDLIFGRTRVPCHRLVLAATCKYFRGMFLTDMSKSDAKEIHMEGISASIGMLLVEYLYSADIKLDCENIKELLSASNVLSLCELRKRIEAFLIEKIDALNCVDFFKLSCQNDLETLSRECKLFVRSHVDDEGMLGGLQEADFVALLTMVESHETRFSLLQRWKSSAEAKKSLFTDFMRHINLRECSRHFVLEKVMSEQLMMNPDGMKLIQDCLLSGDAVEEHKSWFAVGDIEGHMWLCDDDQHWLTIQQPPSTASNYSACASPGGFILTGGERDDAMQRYCYSYNVQDKQWKTLPPMTTARSCHSSIYGDNKLFVAGGRDGQTQLDSVEMLDMGGSLQWSQLPRLPRALQNTLMIVVSDSLFILGGFDGKYCVDVCLFSEGEWRQRACMPEKCWDGDVVRFEDHVFVVGGDRKCCQRYNPSDDSWLCSLARPQLRHYFGRAFVWKNKILLWGGEGTDSIEEYSPVTDQWSTWTLKLPTNRQLMFALRE